MKTTLFALSLFLAASSLAHAGKVVRFTIEPKEVRAQRGLGLAWNDKQHAVLVRVGDTLEIVNKDTVDHIVHTSGTPFPHGNRERPIHSGESIKIVITKAHDPEKNGALYDHLTGKESGQLFWILAK